MADLDELLSEGLISPRALDRLNTIYAPSSDPLAPPSQESVGADLSNLSWPKPLFPGGDNLALKAFLIKRMANVVLGGLANNADFYHRYIGGPLDEARQIESGHPEGTQTQATVDALHRFFNGGSGDPEQDEADRKTVAGAGASMANWVATPGLGRAAMLPPGETSLGAAGGRIGAPIRRFGIPAAADPPIFSYRNTSPLYSHPDYVAAKAGDPEAAARFVLDMAKPETVEAARQRFGPDVNYAPVHAEEEAGRNAIPHFLADYYAEATGADVAPDIVQTSRAYHTGANAMARMIARPTFEGPVEAGQRYVLVDDVGVMGNTLAELANHIRSNGGQVAGVTTLVHRSPLEYYAADPDAISQLVAKHGQAIHEHFGIDPGALTAQEAEYLLRFGTTDTLRNRIAEAARERNARLRSKGVRPSETEGGE
jgi:hypothetical protein